MVSEKKIAKSPDLVRYGKRLHGYLLAIKQITKILLTGEKEIFPDEISF